MGFFEKLKSGLSKTRAGFTERIEQLITGYTIIDDDLIEEVEAILLGADVGFKTTNQLIEDIRRAAKLKEITAPDQIKNFLASRIANMLGTSTAEENVFTEKPYVILVVGVNGVGKTTTIGKLGHYFNSLDKKVVLAAGDTFRAAAIDQLEIWGNRSGVEIIKHVEGSDPAAVAFDAAQAAKARNSDILIVDTAGRLHTKSNLMEELKKIQRIITREIPGAPHEVLLVLDATTGQNAINQAKLFMEAVSVSGVVLTKLDGTAKGGVVIAINSELCLPVKWVGVGESAEDLRPFDSKQFAEALFGI